MAQGLTPQALGPDRARSTLCSTVYQLIPYSKLLASLGLFPHLYNGDLPHRTR